MSVKLALLFDLLVFGKIRHSTQDLRISWKGGLDLNAPSGYAHVTKVTEFQSQAWNASLVRVLLP